jgi:hypothetical protein
LIRYSAAYGGGIALHEKIIGLLEETVGDQLPPLIRFRDDDIAVNFASALVVLDSNSHGILRWSHSTRSNAHGDCGGGSWRGYQHELPLPDTLGVDHLLHGL